MVRIRQEAVQEARFSVIRIAGLVRQGMVYMVRDDVKFFRHQLYYQVSGKETPELIAEAISLVGAIAMVPDSTVSAHQYHSINEAQ